MELVSVVYIGCMLSLGAFIAFVIRKALPFIISSPSVRHNNLGLRDRAIRFFIASLFLAWGIYSGNPVAFVAAGFIFFEAFAQWCMLYALLGKSSCPM